MVLYEMVCADEPLYVCPEEAPVPLELKVSAFCTEPEEPPMLRVEVETEYRVPELAPTTPFREPSVGRVVKLFEPENVLLPLKVFEFERSVDEAAVMVMSAEPLKEVPLMLRAV